MHNMVEEARAVRQLPSPSLAKAIRVEARISRRRLGIELGVHEITIFRWENGTSRPRGQALVDYAKLLAALRAEARSA